MATNAEILTEIAILKEQTKTVIDKTEEVLVVAKSNERALRGHNSSIGVIARVKSIEDKRDDQDKKLDRQARIFYGTGVTVVGAIIIDVLLRWLNT